MKILKFSTLEDEFLHPLREFLTSNHTANDDYHLLKLKIKNGETIFSFFHFPHPFIFSPSTIVFFREILWLWGRRERTAGEKRGGGENEKRRKWFS